MGNSYLLRITQQKSRQANKNGIKEQLIRRLEGKTGKLEFEDP